MHLTLRGYHQPFTDITHWDVSAIPQVMQLVRVEARNMQRLNDEVESLSSLRQQVVSLSARIVVLDAVASLAMGHWGTSP